MDERDHKFLQMLLEEYKYWRNAELPDTAMMDGISVGAIGAISNVVAKLMGLETRGKTNEN